MFSKSLIALLLSGLVSTGFAAGGDAVELSSENFEEFTSGPLSLVEFFAPWCGHCKKLAPEYAEAATALKKVNIPLGTVDATVETDLASKYGVSGYPTLKVFRRGEASDYEGGRTADTIIDYMKSEAKPVIQYVTDKDEFATLVALEDEDTAPIGGVYITLFKDGAEEPAEGEEASLEGEVGEAFVALSSALRKDNAFLVVGSEEIRKEYNVEDNTIVLFRDFDAQLAYDGELNTDALDEWLINNGLPIIGEITTKNLERYQKTGQPIVKIYLNLKRSKEALKHWQVPFAAAAERLKGTLKFAYANAKDFANELSDLGEVDKKGLVSIYFEKKKYKLKGKFSEEALTQFLDDYQAGNLTPHLKSAFAPRQNPKDPVRIVVASTFDEIVNDDSKDVLIEFYAPWCGHCKKLKPVYKKVAKKFKNDKNVVVAIMDATANDVPEPYVATGFPTIYFSPAADADGNHVEPKKYDKGRDKKSFIEYIKENRNTKKDIVKSKKKKKKKTEEAKEEL